MLFLCAVCLGVDVIVVMVEFGGVDGVVVVFVVGVVIVRVDVVAYVVVVLWCCV